MKIFITGATGYLGEQLTKKLLTQGHTICALIRSPKKAAQLAQPPNVELYEGDLLQPDKIRKAMQGCEQAYHLAAYAKVRSKDPHTFYKINVEGTRNVLEAAKAQEVKKIVVTSTAGVLGPAVNGVVHEESPLAIPLSTDYEKTKLPSEKEIQKYVAAGLNAVIVNPTRVYGPGQLSESNATTKLIHQYTTGKWRFLPGDGQSVGNYVYIEDVVAGHCLAMEKGKAGERYILGGENASFQKFFQTIREVTSVSYQLYQLPIWLMMAFAKIQRWRANTFGKPPLITPPFVRRYLYNWVLSTEKAERTLGYQPTALKTGIRKTVDWLEENKNLVSLEH
ncbi:MAG: SDR family oxidoreductase [Thermonemataceae bacterium]